MQLCFSIHTPPSYPCLVAMRNSNGESIISLLFLREEVWAPGEAVLQGVGGTAALDLYPQAITGGTGSRVRCTYSQTKLSVPLNYMYMYM